MNRNIVRLTGLAVLAAVLPWLWGQTSPAVQKITVLPSRVHTRVVLDSSAPLIPLSAAYSPSLPAALVLEFGPSKWPAAPAVPADEPPLLRSIQVETKPNGRTVLTAVLAEKVPFQVWAEGNRTVVELVKYQRGAGDYQMAPETQQELAAAPNRPSVKMKGIAVADKAGRAEISAALGRKAVTNIFALDNPTRLIVDIFDTDYAEPTVSKPLTHASVSSVKVGQYSAGPPHAITRLVLDLREAARFSLDNTPAAFKVIFGGEPTVTAAPAAAQPEVTPAVKLPAVKPEAEAKPAAGKPAAAKTEPAAKKETPPAAATQTKTAPPAKTEAAPQVPAKKESLRADEAAAAKLQTRTLQDSSTTYQGEVLSPRFREADLKDVVIWLGERYGLNVIFDPAVRGTVTCTFTDIPWDQFLDIILRNLNLGKTLDGNVLRIAPQAKLAQEQTDDQRLRSAREDAGPLLTKTYALSYAKAKDITDLIKTRKSQRGDITVDDRTNQIIVSDSRERLDLMEKLIDVLDTPPPQVSIEARIVEATRNFIRNVGIQWGFKGVADPNYGNQTSLQFPNQVSVDGAIIPQGQVTKGLSGPLGGYAINLPSPAFNSAVGLSFANVLDSLRLDVALTAMESEGTGSILSAPTVTTMNNKEAYVIRGRQIPVQTQANFTVSTQFVPAALELKVTPQITSEGTIIMSLEISNNAADFGNPVNGIPPITTQSAKTQVMVADGGTTVIGGIYRVEDSISRERVPFLHQIPILGSLFKSLSKTKQNQELLIFITPRILK